MTVWKIKRTHWGPGSTLKTKKWHTYLEIWEVEWRRALFGGELILGEIVKNTRKRWVTTIKIADCTRKNTCFDVGNQSCMIQSSFQNKGCFFLLQNRTFTGFFQLPWHAELKNYWRTPQGRRVDSGVFRGADSDYAVQWFAQRSNFSDIWF